MRILFLKYVGIPLGILTLAFFSLPVAAATPLTTTAPTTLLNSQCGSNVPVLGTGANLPFTACGSGALGTAAYDNTGTTGATIPLNNGGFTQSGVANFTSTFEIGGTAETFPASGLLVGTTDLQTLTNKSLTSPTITSSFTATGLVILTDLATQATNTIVGNATSGTASPTALAIGSCSTSANALTWTTNSGFGCNASITAAAVPASGLTGTTLNSSVTASSLTSVGTLTALTVSGGVTFSGLATSGTIGGSVCRTSAGILLYESGINCFSAAASSVTVGTTTVASGTTTEILYQNGASPAGTIGEYAISGTGSVAMNTTPTFVTNITAPLVIGGTGASSSLTLESTSGAGTSDSIVFATGSQATAWTISTAGILTGSATTASTSISTGALVTPGGIGVTKAAWIGGLVNVAGVLTASGTTASTTTTTGEIVDSGGLGVAGAIFAGSTLSATGGVTFAGLATSGTIGGTVCATSAGILLYESGVNCFAGTAASITVGTTTIASGTTAYVLYQNGASPAGTVGEYPITGTAGSVVLSTTPTFITNITDPLVIGGTAASSTLTLESTSGVGTSDSIILKTGSQVTAWTISTAGVLTGAATTTSTSTTTGALITAGGLGVAGPAWVGGLENVAGVLTASGSTASTSITSGEIVSSGGLGVTGAAWIGGLENVAGILTASGTTASSSTTTGEIVDSGGLGVAGATFIAAITASGVVTESGTTASTSTTTGNVINSGGEGIAKALWVGGLANVAGVLTASGSTASTSITSGEIVDSGGLGVNLALWVGGLENVAGVLTASGTTASTTTTTGEIVDSGGLGVAGAIFAGSTLSATGGVTFAGLATSGTIGGSVCATSAGILLYESGVNCFAGTASSITIGTTTVASGTTTEILYQNGASPTGTIGEYAITGTGSVVMSTTPTFVTSAFDPLLIGGTTASSTLTLESTSGAGTSDSIIFATGSQATAWTITTAGILTGAATTVSTSISTGALVTAGGLGVTKAAWIGGLENVAGVFTASGTTASTTTTTGEIVDSGGLGVAGAIFAGSTLSATGGVTFAGLATSGTIGGALCATSAGILLYESGVNCFAASAASITVGTTTLASGTTAYVLYQNGASPTGTVGEYAITGTGSVVMSSAPSIDSPTITTAFTATGLVTLADVATQAANTILANVTGSTASPTAYAMASCSAAGDGEIYTTSTGLGCYAHFATLVTADQTLSGGANLTVYSIGTGSGTETVDCGENPSQFVLNTGAFTLAAPTNDGNCIVEVVNGPSAGTLTLTGFHTSPTGGGDTYATTLTVSSAAVTVSSGTPGVVTYTNTFVGGEPVYFTATTMPTGMTASVIYYVLATGLTTAHFEIAATPGGTAINTSSTGTTVVLDVPSVYLFNVIRLNGEAIGVWKQMQ